MNFVTFLHNMYNSITFTVQVEQNGQLPFPDILIKRQLDGTLSCPIKNQLTQAYTSTIGATTIQPKRMVCC